MLLHEVHSMERYVTTTYRLEELFLCAQGGYVTTLYNLYTIEEKYSSISIVLVFIEFQSLVDGPETCFIGAFFCLQASQPWCNKYVCCIYSFFDTTISEIIPKRPISFEVI